MSAMKVLAVDDEAPALDELSYLLAHCPLVERVEVARSATAALRQLHDDEYDAVFLDVRMPGLDGLELARVLGRFARPPAVVFVTAYETHALEAFDVGAAGYLLKPVQAVHLDRALRRAMAQRALGDPAGRDGGGATGGNGAEPAPESRPVVPVELGARTLLVPRGDIAWVESSGDYVRLHLRDGASHLLRTPMAVLEQEWSDAGFVRVHRSYLVSVRDIAELRSVGSRTSIQVCDQELPVSRRHIRELRDRLVRQARPGHGSPLVRAHHSRDAQE